MRPYGTKRLGTKRYGARSSGSRQARETRGPGVGQRNERTRVFRKKVCRFCGERAVHVDYKEVERLSKFLTEKGKIIPRRISGNCAKHQRMLARAVKGCRHSGLVPFQVE